MAQINAGAGQSISDDEMTLMLVAVMAWPALAGAVAWAWIQGGSWLVKHQILVSAKAGPLVALPGMGGAGLDVARLSIAAGVVVVLVALTVAGIGRAVAVRRSAGI